MNQIFYTHKTLSFREADPAGIMFFGNIFAFAHDAFEEFIVSAGYSYNEWFGEFDYIIPIRHSESDFLSPLIPGQTYDIEVTVAKLGQSSFQMKYVFSKNKKLHAIVKMVHTMADRKTLKKIPLPDLIRSRLTPFTEDMEAGKP